MTNSTSSTLSLETMATLCELYLTKHAALKKKPSSVKLDHWLVDKHILPRFQNRLITEITSRDISLFHHALSETPTQANRILEVLSKMFNLAERWGLRTDYSNPCRHIDKYPERQVNRFLSTDELLRLWDVLRRREKSGDESIYVLNAFRLLLLTGCRLSEIQFLKWSQIDWKQGVFCLSDSKTGPRYVALNDAAIEVLQTMPRKSPYVILNPNTGRPIQNLQKPWRRIRKEAEIEDVRIHDLRHTFASNAISAGLTLPAIGKLLGHRQPQTTQRYAHVAFAYQKEAANRVGEQIIAGLKGGVGGCGGQI